MNNQQLQEWNDLNREMMIEQNRSGHSQTFYYLRNLRDKTLEKNSSFYENTINFLVLCLVYPLVFFDLYIIKSWKWLK